MNRKKYRYLLLFVFGVMCIMTGCRNTDIELFDGDRALYFPNVDGQDTMAVSFFNYPNKDVVPVEFEIALIGKVLDRDAEYDVKVVDTLTTAASDEYSLPTLTFKAGQVKDMFKVNLHKSARLSEKQVSLVFEIVPNKNFNAGFFNKLTVQVKFDNIDSKPLWWDDSITDTFLGTYSKEKFIAFCDATNTNTMADLEPWEMRKLALKTKEHIKKNNITEKDGSEMIIPCY